MTTLRFKVEFGQRGRATKARPSKPAAPKPLSRSARQLALAYWVEQKIEAGELHDLADAARLLGVTRARMTQIVNLRFLPPAVQEQVLTPGFEGSAHELRAHVMAGGVTSLGTQRAESRSRKHAASKGNPPRDDAFQVPNR